MNKVSKGQLKEKSEKNESNDVQNNSETILPMDCNQDHSSDMIEINESQSESIKPVKYQVLNEMNPNLSLLINNWINQIDNTDHMPLRSQNRISFTLGQIALSIKK
ncbi:unnamed protein product [Schistosoma curassoni]|uniref:Uncharacterized protein n=1 Tax=Schistosoma curassoni TaxID=6186 RepID=A0A183KKH7_9TREM|nr:unnamed protein product [Schistosoma curassoni]